MSSTAPRRLSSVRRGWRQVRLSIRLTTYAAAGLGAASAAYTLRERHAAHGQAATALHACFLLSVAVLEAAALTKIMDRPTRSLLPAATAIGALAYATAAAAVTAGAALLVFCVLFGSDSGFRDATLGWITLLTWIRWGRSR